MRKHRAACDRIDAAFVPYELMQAAKDSWDGAIELGQKYGFRNGQITVLAPTGTIAFLMDCDTTGVEPDIAIVKYKRLVGGGLLKIVNHTVPEALHQARLHRQGSRSDRRAHRHQGHDRGRAAPQGRAPAGVRLRVPLARTARARSTTWATSA